MKALKLPPFNEDKDDLDAYLTRFERACTAFDVEPDCLHYITCCIYCIVGLSMAGIVQTDHLLLFYVAYNTHACYATK